MPVTENTSNLIHSPYVPDSVPPDPMQARGRPIVPTGTVANAADDSSGSTFHLVDLPSNCLLSHDVFFDVTNWGFAQINIGTADDIDALITVAKTAGNMVAPIAKGDANHGKYLWEILGLAADPGGKISLYAHASAAATAAGSMKFQTPYLFS